MNLKIELRENLKGITTNDVYKLLKQHKFDTDIYSVDYDTKKMIAKLMAEEDFLPYIYDYICFDIDIERLEHIININEIETKIKEIISNLFKLYGYEIFEHIDDIKFLISKEIENLKAKVKSIKNIVANKRLSYPEMKNYSKLEIDIYDNEQKVKI